MPRRTDRPRWRPTPDTAIAMLALAVAAGGGGYAVAAVTAGPQVFACLDAATGQPTKIATAGGCSPGQTQLAWDQSGPQGPQGPPGQQGAQGVQGPAGPAGKDAVAQVVVAGPRIQKAQYARTFTIKGTVSGSGWFQLHGHVEWRQLQPGRDVALHCSINRFAPFQTLDTYNLNIPKNDLFGVGTVEEYGYVLLPRTADPGAGGVVQPAAPVTVTFKCTAVTGSKRAAGLVFQDPTLTITPAVKE